MRVRAHGLCSEGERPQPRSRTRRRYRASCGLAAMPELIVAPEARRCLCERMTDGYNSARYRMTSPHTASSAASSPEAPSPRVSVFLKANCANLLPPITSVAGRSFSFSCWSEGNGQTRITLNQIRARFTLLSECAGCDSSCVSSICVSSSSASSTGCSSLSLRTICWLSSSSTS